MSVLNPVRVSEILPLQQQKIEGSTIAQLLGDRGRVYVAQGNVVRSAFPDPDSEGFAGRVVLMQRNDSPREFLDMTIPYYFNVKVEIVPGQYDDVNIICDNIHKTIYELLQDTTISPDGSTQIFKTWRKWVSTQVRYDQAVGCYYQTAVYQTILTPNQI